MNPKRQVVEQAIADLREHQQALKIMSKQYTPSVYDPEVENLMAELYEERVNIANRLFVVTQSSGIQLPSPNSRYYDPNPSPVFNVEDFQDFRRNKPLSYPVIVGNLTKYLDHIDYTILTIDRFIEQLERKLKRRKDLQENIVMKLTETKLKQMILEMMSQSEDYYKKLKSLLTTEEGYLQADSLFEMVKHQLDAKHRMYMLNLLEPLHIGKEIHQAIQRANEAYERYTQAYESFEDPRQASQYQLDQTEQAFQQYEDASMTHRDLRIQLNNRLDTMRKAGVEQEIILVAYDVARNAMNGEYK